jgi:HemY protein
MIRILVALALLAAVALGFAWIADRPGDVSLVWMGQRYETTVAVALAIVLAAAFALAVLFNVLRLVWRLPARIGAVAQRRRHRKGREALTRGMIAAGAGDLRSASRAAEEAGRHLEGDPLLLVLQAQTAQLAGDRDRTEHAFRQMAERKDTRLLGLRGLHAEARRRGDAAAAHDFAEQAHKIAPLPWAGRAVLEHHSAGSNWAKALAAVEANLAQRLIDRPTANRQRAVLLTALAGEQADREPSEALRLAREAVDLAPDLVPAAALAGRLLARRGDLRRASKLLETAWKVGPHPDLARVYLDLRPGDSTSDRLQRARTLSRLAQDDPESALLLARAAIDARDFTLARSALDPLVGTEAPQRPTVRMCLLMADLEEAESGDAGRVREWLARASRAPRDKAWVADGVVSDTWGPVSPTTGKLDAYRWQTPPERLSTTYAPPEPAPLPEAIKTVDIAPALPEPPVSEAVEIAEPTSIPVALPEAAATATMVSQPPVEEEPVPDPTARLAAIRAAAKTGTATAPPRKAEVFPLVTAPDDPGPEPHR